MGWSCSALADVTMQRILGRHTTKHGTVVRNGVHYFVAPSKTEHDDGTITGKVVRLDGEPSPAGNTGTVVGTFRIDGGTGVLTKGPAWLHKMAQSFYVPEV